MAPAFLVFLVVTIAWPDEEPWERVSRQPDITTCMVRASHVLEQAATVHSEESYRISAQCTVQWPGHDPA